MIGKCYHHLMYPRHSSEKNQQHASILSFHTISSRWCLHVFSVAHRYASCLHVSISSASPGLWFLSATRLDAFLPYCLLLSDPDAQDCAHHCFISWSFCFEICLACTVTDYNSWSSNQHISPNIKSFLSRFWHEKIAPDLASPWTVLKHIRETIIQSYSIYWASKLSPSYIRYHISKA